MHELTLQAAQTIVNCALAWAREAALKPVAVVVLDARGTLKAAAVEDRSSLTRDDFARAKAYGALALGIGSRSIAQRARDVPNYLLGVSHVVGEVLALPGGVLIKHPDSSPDGPVLGAVGVSGDSSANDEQAALAGIAAAGLHADPGSD